MSESTRDKRIVAQHQRWVELAHRRMTSSYIGPPRPQLLGDAERLVSFLEQEGWTPRLSWEDVCETIDAFEKHPMFARFLFRHVDWEEQGQFVNDLVIAVLQCANVMHDLPPGADE